MAMRSRSSSPTIAFAIANIDKLDFDDHRKPSSTHNGSDHSGPGGLLRDDESLLSNVIDGVIERDRRKMHYSVTNLCAGSITTYSLYGPLFLTRLHYTQFQVNAVSIAGALAQYLPIPISGYLCDRYNPRPLSLAAAFFFGLGYLLAALTYRHGPPEEGGWPVAVMVIAFLGVGLGTCTLVIGCVTTCAKNFGTSKHKGLALALPIAAYGLSGLWLSQVGSQLLHEPGIGGKTGDVDVYRFFLFLSALLFAVSLIGAVALRVVNEEEIIAEAVEELERSGFLEESPLFRSSTLHDSSTAEYGTLSFPSLSSSSAKNEPKPKADALKVFIFNTETHRFLADSSMWLLAAGFFLVIGPGEAFINNLGTIISTLYPPSSPPAPPSNSPALNVSIVALFSTFARLLTGSLSDLLAPASSPNRGIYPGKRHTISRVAFLLASTLLFAISQLILASSLVQHHPSLFPLVSALVGLAYGATFSIIPIIVNVAWGPHNFGTNYGIVALVPAGGAAVWGVVYSAVYQRRIQEGGDEEGGKLCYGYRCYGPTFWAMAACSCVAMGLWGWVWRKWRRRGTVV